jgi:hypothetical protein
MHNSRRYCKAPLSTPLWIERTREALFMCHYCDTSSNADDDFSKFPQTNPSNIRQCVIQQQKQDEKSTFMAQNTSPCWFLMSYNENNFLSSLLWMGHKFNNHQQDDDDFVEVQFGVTSRSLQEDYELYRV